MDSDEEMEVSAKFFDTSVASSIRPVRKHKQKTRFSILDSTSQMLGIDDTTIQNIKLSRHDAMNLSITMNQSELSNLWGTSIHEAQPTNTLDGLFKDFQCVYQNFGNPSQIFDAISSFDEICTGLLEFLCNGKSLTDKQGNDLTWLMNERNTWRLIYALYKDRQIEEENNFEEDEEPHPLSEKELTDNYYKSNRTIREAQIVIDWLEQNAREEWKLLDKQDITLYTDQTVAWENTLCQIQSSALPYKSAKIVRNLDPDAPLRENKPLHDLDLEDEERLLKQIFYEIRKGKLDRAEEICVHCGQPWRAAVLDGWKLFHDPNYTEKGDGKLHNAGNPFRDIWKICAWRMCEDTRVKTYDKAIMGILCGHLESVLPLCKKWEDMLWAYTRTFVDVSVEKEIRDNSLKDFAEMPSKYWKNLISMENVLKQINACDEGTNPERIIQEMVIKGTEVSTSELLRYCSEWVQKSTNRQFLRFMVHIVLVLRQLGHVSPQHLGDDVIRAYIKSLINERETDSIAYYCSLLPEEEQIEQYSDFMVTVNDKLEREECLTAAEKYNLEIASITEKVVHKVRLQTEDVDDETLSKGILEEDIKKIEALDWMVYYPEQRANAIWECNVLIRDFISRSKLSAAREAFYKIPENSTEKIILQHGCELDENGCINSEKLPEKVNAAIKEYLCYKAYLAAEEGYSEWFHQYHSSKPREPLKPQGKLEFAESVAYEHKLKKYNEELNKWKSRMEYLTKVTKAKLYNVITFPSGWLVDDLDEEPRKTLLHNLRHLCIPQIFTLLHKVLHTMELYEEIQDLVIMLVKEETEYYKIFDKQQLKTFLDKAVESSLELVGTIGTPFVGVYDKKDENEPSVSGPALSIGEFFGYYQDRVNRYLEGESTITQYAVEPRSESISDDADFEDFL